MPPTEESLIATANAQETQVGATETLALKREIERKEATRVRLIGRIETLVREKKQLEAELFEARGEAESRQARSNKSLNLFEARREADRLREELTKLRSAKHQPELLSLQNCLISFRDSSLNAHYQREIEPFDVAQLRRDLDWEKATVAAQDARLKEAEKLIRQLVELGEQWIYRGIPT